MVIQGFRGFYWVLQDFTGFKLVLKVLLGFTRFYWVLLGFTGFYWVLLGFTGFYLALLGLMYRDRPTENSTSDFTQILPLWCRRFPFHCLQFCNDFTENRWASLGLCPCPTGQKLAAQLVKTGLSTWILTGRTGILWLHLPDPAGSREVLYIFFLVLYLYSEAS